MLGLQADNNPQLLFDMSGGDLNLDPHACRIRTLTHQTTLAPVPEVTATMLQDEYAGESLRVVVSSSDHIQCAL